MRYSVDWLSGTHWRARSEQETSAFAHQLFGRVNLSECKPLFGYQWAFKAGGIIVESGEREDMGTHVYATGSALSGLTDRHDGYERLMSLIDTITPARLDLAVDSDRDFSEGFEFAAKRGKLTTRAKKWSVIQSQENGRTVYIGSRQSGQFLRVYNKASQMGLSNDTWTRIELESKGKAAIAAKGVVMANGIASAAQSLIRGFCDCDIPEWREAFQCEPLYVSSNKGKGNTRDWIMNQCAPAFKRLVDEGDTTLLDEFLKAVYG